MQQMALCWLVYRLTNSPFMLGLIAFAGQVPSLFLTPFAGIIVDRANRHRLILITQVLAMVQAALLAALVMSGHTQLWQLVALSGMLGAITAFDLPTRQSFLVDMLDDKEQLASAIGINSSINTLSRLVAPFVAGLFLARVGEGICFLINALSYIAVIAALLLVKAKQRATGSSKQGALAQLQEGFVYATGYTPIRDLILLIALVGLFSMPFAILMPAFAKDVFHGNALTLGLLTGALGAGTVIGALFLTLRKGTEELSRWIVTGCALSGLTLIVFGSSESLPLSLLAAAVVGFGSLIMLAGSNTLIQTIVDEDKRGRVMSFVVMAFLGFGPFGCMAAGALANVIGVGRTVVLSGILTLILALIFGSRVLRIHLAVQPADVKEGIAEADAEIMAMNGAG
jgi:MFS family permease